MKIPPIAYNLRSLMVRRSSTALTVLSIGATVAVVAGVLSLQQGFSTLFKESGREDVAVFLRPGAGSEGDSWFRIGQDRDVKTAVPEIAVDEEGLPLASAELFVAIRLFKMDGGETNVTIRGIQPQSLKMVAGKMQLLAGQTFEPGTDEVIVGSSLVERIRDCEEGAVIQLNKTPFRVVGVFEYDGPFGSEIWGDLERMRQALKRPGFSRVVAKLEPGTDVAAIAERMKNSKVVPTKVLSETQYLTDQTGAISKLLRVMGTVLGVIMGVAAVFTGTNTMLSAISSRSHEIGILLAIGFRPFGVFLSFLFESFLLGLFGGLAGCLLVLPLHGVRTGTTNWTTFTEVAFAFRITPTVLLTAVGFAILLGLLGGAIPAWRAARMQPTDALSRA